MSKTDPFAPVSDSYPVIMAPTQLHITVFENGVPFDPSGYSGQELAALIDTIEQLWSPTYHSTRFFEVQQDDEDDSLWLVYRDIKDNVLLPIPDEWMTKKGSFGRKELSYVGDRLPITPPQYGLSAWPTSVHVLFTTE